jgi:hypothetical protein
MVGLSALMGAKAVSQVPSVGRSSRLAPFASPLQGGDRPHERVCLPGRPDPGDDEPGPAQAARSRSAYDRRLHLAALIAAAGAGTGTPPNPVQ